MFKRALRARGRPMEMEMEEKIARLRVHLIEDLRPIAMGMESLAKNINELLRRWEAELNPGRGASRKI